MHVSEDFKVFLDIKIYYEHSNNQNSGKHMGKINCWH